jgi:hypothetical protein
MKRQFICNALLNENEHYDLRNFQGFSIIILFRKKSILKFNYSIHVSNQIMVRYFKPLVYNRGLLIIFDGEFFYLMNPE